MKNRTEQTPSTRCAIFWSTLVAAMALAVNCPAGTSSEAAFPSAQMKAQQPPDVVIMVLSGALPSDQVSFIYNGPVSGKAALADVKAFLGAAGLKAQRIGRPETKGTPKSTSVDFEANGTVNWGTGTLAVEPFVLAFKRFDVIRINYILQGNFPFRSLRNYSDRYVDISWTPGSGAQDYYIRIKDRNFDRLNLPLMVEPPREEAVKEKVEGQGTSGGTKTWLALILALAAGVITFIIISRITRYERSNRAT